MFGKMVIQSDCWIYYNHGRSVGLALRNVDRNTPLPPHSTAYPDRFRSITNVHVAVRESVVKAVQTLG